MERRFRFRYVNEVAGTFVIVGLLLLIGSVLTTARAQRWFKPVHRFSVLLPKGSFGLRPGSELQILGITAGAVEDIRVDGTSVLADVSVNAEFARFLFTDSVALVKKTFGVAGDAFLEITGGGSGPPLEVGATLLNSEPFEELPGLLEQMLADIKAEMVPVLQDVRDGVSGYTELAASLREPDGRLQRGLQSWGRLADVAVEGDGTLARLLRDPQLADDLGAVLRRAQTVLGEAEASAADMRRASSALADAAVLLRTEAERAPGLVTKADAALSDLQGLVSDVREAAATLPAILAAAERTARAGPLLLAQTQQTVRSIERLVEGLQRHWLVRSYVRQESRTPRLTPDEIGGGR